MDGALRLQQDLLPAAVAAAAAWKGVDVPAGEEQKNVYMLVARLNGQQVVLAKAASQEPDQIDQQAESLRERPFMQ